MLLIFRVLVELISLFESVLDKESKRTEKLVLTSLKYSIVVVASVLWFRTGFDTNWKFVDYEEVEGKVNYIYWLYLFRALKSLLFQQFIFYFEMTNRMDINIQI